MKNLAYLVLICFLPVLSAKAQTDSVSNKPLQVFASVGENALNLDPLNKVISNYGFDTFKSANITLGGGIQREIFKNTLFNAEIYIGRSLNHKSSFTQAFGWHTTYGYVIINNTRNRVFPFVGFSINSLAFNSIKPNTVNDLTNYLTNSPEQLSLYTLTTVWQIGFQIDVKRSDDPRRAKSSIRVGYGIGGSNELHQRATSTNLSGGPTINPSGLYVRFYYFIR